MLLDDFIARLQKLRREQGNVQVLIDRTTRSFLELAEPQIIHVVNNGAVIWREATNDDRDEIVETAIEIL